MGRMREERKRIKGLLEADDWQAMLDGIADGGSASAGALFSFLKKDTVLKHRAAVALGMVIAHMAHTDVEGARALVRNFMWHMNEDSGNIGWGIPEAFAETLARSPLLAKDYANILMSYIMDLGHADNYCDNDILRRSCYWAVGRLAQARPDLAEKARPWLIKGLSDTDSICRGNAAWALGQLSPNLMDFPALHKLAESGDEDICEIFEDGGIKKMGVSALAQRAAKRNDEKS